MPSQQEIIQKQQQEKLKLFDYSEAAIKLWLSKCMNCNVEDVFSDYKEDFDIIATRYADHMYYFSLGLDKISHPDNFETLANESEELKRAIHTLFRSIYIVYSPILATEEKVREEFNNVFPEFEKSSKAFVLRMSNKLKITKDQIMNHISNIQKQLYDLRQAKKTETVEYQKCWDVLQDLCKSYNEITESAITEEEKKCIERNRILESYPKLYVNIEVDETVNSDALFFNRLPDMGETYDFLNEDIDVVKTLQEEK